jgi:hypothetical protein
MTMSDWERAVREAYFEGYSGTYARKSGTLHLDDAFGVIARGILHALDAVAAWPDKTDKAGMLAAALVAFRSEKFDDWLQANLPAEEYAGIRERREFVHEYRRQERQHREERAAAQVAAGNK